MVGNSVGGFAAARLAIRRPELVRGLVLVDSGGFLGRSPQVRAFCALMARPRFLRAIYPWFANRYMRPQSDEPTAGYATSASRPPARTPACARSASCGGSFTSPEHDLRAEARLDLGADAGRLGQARPGDPAEGRAHGSRRRSPAPELEPSSTPATRPRSATREGFAAALRPVRRRRRSAASRARPPHERGASLALASCSARPARWSLPSGALDYFERGEGPALLFSHGWLANANLWRKVVDHLRAEFRCLVLDLPLGSHRTPMGAGCRPLPRRRRRPDRRGRSSGSTCTR